jgi:D-alanine-D-alanine ligase
MIKSKLHIEIVRSDMPGLSSLSQESCDAIFGVLKDNYASVRMSVVNNLNDLDAIVTRSPDLVFLGMEFIPKSPILGLQDPSRIWITDYLDTHGITYTGSERSAHQLGRNKQQAKDCISDAGLKTALYRIIDQKVVPEPADIGLSYPLFIKPANRGGGLGIDSDSLVHNFQQLQRKVGLISDKLKSDSLIEEYLPGREFSVAILKHEYSEEFYVMPIELIAPLDQNEVRMLSGKVKSSNAEQAIEVIDHTLSLRINRLALDTFHALGARDYGRIDIRLDSNGTPHFLEANLIPSLISGYGSFPKACLLNLNLGYTEMILRITKLGLDRIIDEALNITEPYIVGETVLSSLEVAV